MNQSANILSGNHFIKLLSDYFSTAISDHVSILKCINLYFSPDKYSDDLRELFKGSNTYGCTSAYYTNNFLAFGVQLKNGCVAHIMSNLNASLLNVMLIPPQSGLGDGAGIEAIIADEIFTSWDLRNSRPPSAQRCHTSYSSGYCLTTTTNLSSNVLLAHLTKTAVKHFANIGEFEVYKEVDRAVYCCSTESPVISFLNLSVQEYLELDKATKESLKKFEANHDICTRVDTLADWVISSKILPEVFERKTGISFKTYQNAKKLMGRSFIKRPSI